jgi:hypothetical protein
MQYGFEFTGPNRAFANPNGTAPDPVSGFGGAGGGLPVPATSFTAVLDASFPPGTYQVRVVGLSASGGLVGTFSDAITIILGPGVFISPNARSAITAPAAGTQLVRGAQVTFTWTVVTGVAQYLFEVTGPNQGFANPNGAAPDPGALGSVVVPGTALVAPVPTELPSGTYQLRVIALTAAGQPIGTFSDAVTVVVP